MELGYNGQRKACMQVNRQHRPAYAKYVAPLAVKAAEAAELSQLA